MNLKEVFLKCCIVFVSLVFLMSLKCRIELGEMKAEKKVEYKSVECLTKQRVIKTEIVSNGGHTGDCISMKITNLTSETKYVLIEAGRVLDSENDDYQDILVVRSQRIDLAPKVSKKVVLNGYCCQSVRKSPVQGGRYSIGNTENKNLLSFAQFIDSNSIKSDGIQQAVWAVAGGAPISSIVDESDGHCQLKLRQMVASLRNEPTPWYTLHFVKDSIQLFTNIHEKLTAKINYFTQKNATINAAVKDDKGHLIQSFILGKPTQFGQHNFDLALTVKGWPKGKYALYLLDSYATVPTRMDFVL